MSYYLVITGWTLAYVLFSISGTEPQFSEFISSYLPILFFIIAAVLSAWWYHLASRGDREDSHSGHPIVLHHPHHAGHIRDHPGRVQCRCGFLFTPDLSVLSRADLWSAAFGQAFFSLSVGYGILITYGGYLERNVSIPRSSMIITFADLSVAILAGLVIFPIAFTVGLEPSLGAELAFCHSSHRLRQHPVREHTGHSVLYFLFFAALTSAISMLEVNVTVVMDKLRISANGPLPTSP